MTKSLCHKMSFIRKWRVEIAMALARRFETYVTSLPLLTAIQKKLSETAVQRRGRHKMSFIRRWRVEIAMTIARRGAQVAVRRASVIKRNTFTDHEYEQLNLESVGWLRLMVDIGKWMLHQQNQKCIYSLQNSMSYQK